MNSWWALVIRTIMGVYWVYFSSQKWFDATWVKPIIHDAGLTNPISPLASLITNVLLPQWSAVILATAFIEALVGVALLLGLFTRIASLLGAIVSSSLALSFLGLLNDPALAWFYVLSIIGNLAVLTNDPVEPWGLDRLVVRKWPRLVLLAA